MANDTDQQRDFDNINLFDDVPDLPNPDVINPMFRNVTEDDYGIIYVFMIHPFHHKITKSQIKSDRALHI